MKYELWTLAVSSCREPESPYATIHTSSILALRSLLDTFDVRLPPGENMTEQTVDALLVDVANFSLELVIIDTDELEGR